MKIEMKDEIAGIVSETMLGVRKGVGKARKEEFKGFVDSLIEAKTANVDLGCVLFPMLSDKVNQSIEANISSETKAGIEGGLIWKLANLSGNYGTDKKEALKIKVDMEFKSSGYINYDAIKELNVENLKLLITKSDDSGIIE